MQLRISSADGVPIYQQIVNQVRHLIAAGRLQSGEELPPIRVLAEQLTVNPNTVARAYLELEHAGMVTKRHGAGTYVSETRETMSQREKTKILARRADALLIEARHLGCELNEVIKLLRDQHSLMNEEAHK
ncbi:MAG TPA: GntR family transcriptional regulator [Verrucomicrobiae bacterium]|nr:GntR family transcriptional regulator [Verrucomicrobiae bacterium]